jgi:Ca-activated chloride channel family protein
VFLSVLGFGRGNLNDAMMEAIADHGNGNYSYVDNRTEARRVLVEQLTRTLVTIAKDVKIQVEFNPAKVSGYRLIGYENRMLRTEDFNDDKKDAGEIGAGHTVTALYEIVPAGKKVDVVPADDLKYQQPVGRTILSDQSNEDEKAAEGTDKIVRPTDIPSAELLTLKMRYKAPEGDTSKKLEWPVTDAGKSFNEATDDFQFAAAVAGFGMLLRDSQHKGNLTYAADLELAQTGLGRDENGYRAEFLEMVKRAKQLKGE